MYLAVNSLIDRNNVTGSNNIALKRVNVTPCVYDQTYMNKDLIEVFNRRFFSNSMKEN